MSVLVTSFVKVTTRSDLVKFKCPFNTAQARHALLLTCMHQRFYLKSLTSFNELMKGAALRIPCVTSWVKITTCFYLQFTTDFRASLCNYQHFIAPLFHLSCCKCKTQKQIHYTSRISFGIGGELLLSLFTCT